MGRGGKAKGSLLEEVPREKAQFGPRGGPMTWLASGKTRLMTQSLYVYHAKLSDYVISTHKLLIVWNKQCNLPRTGAIISHSCFKLLSCARPQPRVWVFTPVSTVTSLCNLRRPTPASFSAA